LSTDVIHNPDIVLYFFAGLIAFYYFYLKNFVINNLVSYHSKIILDIVLKSIKKRINCYIALTRNNRPIGWLLLYIPCLYGIISSSIFSGKIIEAKIIVLFLLGSIFMRSAGCIFNDIIDREIDSKVERTKNRPLANKSMSLTEAIILLLLLLLLSLYILISLNFITILIGLASIILVILYPFMKRITHWPQLFLGITFNWGVIMGWTSVSETLSPVTFLIYISAIFWTLGYDTVYGYQDIVDDKIIGVKSTAVLFEKNPKIAIYCFYISSFLLMLSAMIWIESSFKTFIVLNCTAFLCIVLIGKLNLKNVQSCANFFSANKYIGFLVVLALILSV